MSSHRHCNVIDLKKEAGPVLATVVDLTSKPPIKICIYANNSDDQFVSRAIRQGNVWESRLVDVIMGVLKRSNQLGLIDVGANVGQYSLIAAKMGHRVVAVEALKRHVDMIHMSAQLNNVEEKVVLIHNAVSNNRRKVAIYQYPGNPGHSFIVNTTASLNGLESNSHTSDSYKGDVEVQTIKLDDLLEVTQFSKAVMKIDIEGHEPFAILSSATFLEKIEIPYIFMEFGLFNRVEYASLKPVVDKMLSFLYSRHYVPYGYDMKQLPKSSWKRWPWEVILKLDDWRVHVNIYPRYSRGRTRSQRGRLCPLYGSRLWRCRSTAESSDRYNQMHKM